MFAARNMMMARTGGAIPRTLASYNFTSGMAPSFLDGALSGGTIAGTNLVTFQTSTGLGYATQPILDLSSNSTTLADAVTNNRYASLTITGVALITAVDINAARGGASTPRGFAIYTNQDSYASPLISSDVPTVRPTLTAYNYTGSIPVSGSLILRIYPYTPGSAFFMEFDGLVITGT